MVKKSHSSSTFTACSTSTKMVILPIKRKEAHSSYTITFISISSPVGSSSVSYWFKIRHGKLLEALVLATFNHYVGCRKKEKNFQLECNEFCISFPLLNLYTAFLILRCISAFDMSEERLNEPAKNERGENNLKMHGQK